MSGSGRPHDRECRLTNDLSYTRDISALG
jgi:hypothetical protein